MKIVGRERRDGASSEVVGQAVEETQRYIHDAEESAWRAAFRPHAVIVTNRERPEPLFVAFFIGVNRLVRVDFDLTKGPITFLRQALEGVREKLSECRGDRLPAFGRPVGVVVNYSPDRAIQFDLTGKPIAIFDKAASTRKNSLLHWRSSGNGGRACGRVFVPLKFAPRHFPLFWGQGGDTSDTESKTSLREEN